MLYVPKPINIIVKREQEYKFVSRIFFPSTEFERLRIPFPLAPKFSKVDESIQINDRIFQNVIEIFLDCFGKDDPFWDGPE